MKASELKMDLTKERLDYAAMIGIYVGNKAAQIDPTEAVVYYDYDSFWIIRQIANFANSYDFEMCEEGDEWLIDTETAREVAFQFADGLVKEMIG